MRPCGIGVGDGVTVGGIGVFVGGTGVAVGGTGVAVGGTEVAVGTGVAVGVGIAHATRITSPNIKILIRTKYVFIFSSIIFLRKKPTGILACRFRQLDTIAMPASASRERDYCCADKSRRWILPPTRVEHVRTQACSNATRNPIHFGCVRQAIIMPLYVHPRDSARAPAGR